MSFSLSLNGPKMEMDGLRRCLSSPKENSMSKKEDIYRDDEPEEEEISIENSSNSFGISQNMEEKRRNEEITSKRNSEIFSRKFKIGGSFVLSKRSNISGEEFQSQDIPKTVGGGQSAARLLKKAPVLKFDKKGDDESMRKSEKSPSLNDLHFNTKPGGTKKSVKLIEDKTLMKGEPESSSKTKVNGLKIIKKVKGAINNLRERAGIQCIKNLRSHQASIINDWSFYQECEEDKEEDDPFNQALMFQKLLWNKTIQLAGQIGKTINSPLKMLYFHVPLEITYKMMKKIPALRPNSKIKLVMDFFKLLMIVINFFLITVSISFDQSFQSILFDTCEINRRFVLWIWVVFGFFCFDMALKINTGYYELGVPILDRRTILRRYLKTDFRQDICSFVPLVLHILNIKLQIINEVDLRYVYLLFFFRYYDLRKVIATIEEISFVDEMNEAFYSLFSLIAQTLLISHIFACLWHIMAYTNTSENSWLIDSGLVEKGWQTKYYFSIYWALTTMITIGYGDITAKNESEVLFCIAAMLVGCAVFAYSINQVGFILEKIIKRNHELKQHIIIFNRFMQRKNINHDLQMRVRKYLEYIWNEEKMENTVVEEEIMNKLSSSLREEVLLQSQGGNLKNFPMFFNNFSDETLRKLIQIMKQVRFTPEEIIFEEGFADDQGIYLISKGEVEIILAAQRRDEKNARMCVLSTGQTFGEISFFTDQPRGTTARSLNFCTAYLVKRNDFLDIIRNSPTDYETYCLIRDEYLLYESLNLIDSRCHSCKDKNHLLKTCPKVNYVPDKDFLIRKYLQKHRNFKKRFKRKDKKLNWKTLKDHLQIAQSQAWFQAKEKELIEDALYKINEEGEENSESKSEDSDEGQLSEKYKDTAAESSSPGNSPTNQQRNNSKAFHKLVSKKTFEMKKKEDEEKFEIMKSLKSLKTVSPAKKTMVFKFDAEEKAKSNLHRKQINTKLHLNVDLPDKEEASSPELRSHKDNYPNSLFKRKESRRLTSQQDPHLSKEEKRILEYYFTEIENEKGNIFDMKFDKMWIMEKYFPHNNADAVISKYFSNKIKKKKSKMEKRSFMNLQRQRQSMRNMVQNFPPSPLLKIHGKKSFETEKKLSSGPSSFLGIKKSDSFNKISNHNHQNKSFSNIFSSLFK